MGNSKSARQEDNREGPSDCSETSDNFLDGYLSKIDEQVINTIKKDLKETPEVFVMNNILMSVMFFEDYQKEIKEIISKLAEQNKEYLEPDLILDKVNKNVRYRPFHGPKKYESEPLAPKRVYAVSNKVKVINPLLEDEICQEKPVVRMEESKRKGYIRLKDVNPSIPWNADIITRSNSSNTSRSSTDSDPIYAFSTMTEITTPKPIEICMDVESKETLPDTCYVYFQKKRLDLDVAIAGRNIKEISEDEFYELSTYLSSKEYMKYFSNSLFPNVQGPRLGLSKEDIVKSKKIPGKIFCQLTETEQGHITYEVVPALIIKWPNQVTLEFLMKGQRKPEPKKRHIFPTQSMIKEIESLDCVVVPKGYFQRKGVKHKTHLEWEINFPIAELYLQRYMHHAQMKCFLFLATLHKTFVEPKTYQHGLLIEHVRNLMFWECEFNYTDWPEHRLGSKLIQIINKLNQHLTKGELFDYFINDKNVFKDIPMKYLRNAQEEFHNVLQSPLMSFIKALRNLRYTKVQYFYPPLNFDELTTILMRNEVESNLSQEPEVSLPSDYKQTYSDPETQLKHLQELKARERHIRKTIKLKELEKKRQERRSSTDSINMDWTCETEFDIQKTNDILKIFINQFIAMANKSFQIASQNQTNFYLKQAIYLTKILIDVCPTLKDEAEEFAEQIKILQDKRDHKKDMSGQEKKVHFSSDINIA